MARTKKEGPVTMIGKLVSGFVGKQVAQDAGKSGLLGAVVGMAATRIITRSPIGALTVGGAWLAHKMWRRQQERAETQAALRARPVKSASGPAPAANAETVAARAARPAPKRKPAKSG